MDEDLLALADEVEGVLALFGPEPAPRAVTPRDVAETAALLGWLPTEPYLSFAPHGWR